MKFVHAFISYSEDIIKMSKSNPSTAKKQRVSVRKLPSNCINFIGSCCALLLFVAAFFWHKIYIIIVLLTVLALIFNRIEAKNFWTLVPKPSHQKFRGLWIQGLLWDRFVVNVLDYLLYAISFNVLTRCRTMPANLHWFWFLLFAHVQSFLFSRALLLRGGQISRETNSPWQLRLHERLQLLLSATEPLTGAGYLMWTNRGIY